MVVRVVVVTEQVLRHIIGLLILSLKVPQKHQLGLASWIPFPCVPQNYTENQDPRISNCKDLNIHFHEDGPIRDQGWEPISCQPAPLWLWEPLPPKTEHCMSLAELKHRSCSTRAEQRQTSAGQSRLALSRAELSFQQGAWPQGRLFPGCLTVMLYHD